MSRYVWTFVALLLLTGLTLGISFLHLEALGVVLAMLIAAAKAALIVLFFMHMVEENTTIRVAVVSGLLLVATLLVLTIVDVRARSEPGEPPVTTLNGAPVSGAGQPSGPRSR